MYHILVYNYFDVRTCFFKFEIYEWFCALTLYKDLYGLILDLVIV